MIAPWNVAVVDDVLRVVRRSGLGRDCVSLCADCLVRVVCNCCDSASHRRCEVSGVSLAHAFHCFVWRLPRARCWRWFQTLRQGTGAEFEVILVAISMTVLCGGCVVQLCASRKQMVLDYPSSPSSMCSQCSVCCSLHDARCMNAPSNVADADHVLRLVRGPGLGSVCLTLCAHCLGRVVGSGLRFWVL